MINHRPRLTRLPASWRLATLLATMMLAIGGGVLGPTAPAYADGDPGESHNSLCQAGEFCMKDYGGSWSWPGSGDILDTWYLNSNYSGDTWLNSTQALNDDLSSAKNNTTDYPLRAWQHAGYSGSSLKWSRTWESCNQTICHTYNLWSEHTGFDQMLSSHMWVES